MGTVEAQIPAQVRELMQMLPNIDRTTVLAIANKYKMDLGDPSFLPLLLCQQGIVQLEQARADFVDTVQVLREGLQRDFQQGGDFELLKLTKALNGLTTQAEASYRQSVRDGFVAALNATKENSTAVFNARIGEIDHVMRRLNNLLETAPDTLKTSIQAVANAEAATFQKRFDGAAEQAERRIVDATQRANGNLKAAIGDASKATEALTTVARRFTWRVITAITIASSAIAVVAITSIWMLKPSEHALLELRLEKQALENQIQQYQVFMKQQRK